MFVHFRRQFSRELPLLFRYFIHNENLNLASDNLLWKQLCEHVTARILHNGGGHPLLQAVIWLILKCGLYASSQTKVIYLEL